MDCSDHTILEFGVDLGLSRKSLDPECHLNSTLKFVKRCTEWFAEAVADLVLEHEKSAVELVQVDLKRS